MGNNAFMEKLRVTVQRERDQAATEAADLMKWLCLVATKTTCGLSQKGAEAWMDNVKNVFDEFEGLAKEDRDLTLERLRRTVEQILGKKVERVD